MRKGVVDQRKSIAERADITVSTQALCRKVMTQMLRDDITQMLLNLSQNYCILMVLDQTMNGSDSVRGQKHCQTIA